MNNTIKTIGTIALVGGSAYLIYRVLKKYVVKDSDDEKSVELDIQDASLQSAPITEYMKDGKIDFAEYVNAQKNKKIGDKILQSYTKEEVAKIEKNKGVKIKNGVTYKDYFIRASNDKKGRLVVGKKNGRKSVYKIFGTMYLPFKVKSIYDGGFAIADVDFNEVIKDSDVKAPIKLIDNTGKTFFVSQVELDNLLKRLESNSKKFKFITDKADFVLTRV
jgi:hypothetical protein